MLSCNCTLPYLNPDACKNCSIMKNYLNNNIEYPIQEHVPIIDPLNPNISPVVQHKTKKVKKISKSIKKYDKNGKYLGEKIIEISEEIIDAPNYTFVYTNTESTQ